MPEQRFLTLEQVAEELSISLAQATLAGSLWESAGV